MKKFFNKIVLFIKGLFTNLDEWIHDNVQPAIDFVEGIKRAVGGKTVDLLVTLTPFNWDNNLRDIFLAALTKAIDALHVTAGIANEPDWTSKVYNMIEYIKTLSKPMQDAIYLKLASEIAKAKANQEDVKGHSVDLLVQMQYSKMKENATAETLPSETIIDGEVQTASSAPAKKAVAKKAATKKK